IASASFHLGRQPVERILTLLKFLECTPLGPSMCFIFRILPEAAITSLANSFTATYSLLPMFVGVSIFDLTRALIPVIKSSIYVKQRTDFPSPHTSRNPGFFARAAFLQRSSAAFGFNPSQVPSEPKVV